MIIKTKLVIGGLILAAGVSSFWYGHEIVLPQYEEINTISGSEITTEKLYDAGEIVVLVPYMRIDWVSELYPGQYDEDMLGNPDDIYSLVSVKDKNGDAWIGSMVFGVNSEFYDMVWNYCNDDEMNIGDCKFSGFVTGTELVLSDEGEDFYDKTVYLCEIHGYLERDKVLPIEFEYVGNKEQVIREKSMRRNTFMMYFGVVLSIVGAYLICTSRVAYQGSADERCQKSLEQLQRIAAENDIDKRESVNNISVIPQINECIEQQNIMNLQSRGTIVSLNGVYKGGEFPIMSEEVIRIGRRANIIIDDPGFDNECCYIRYNGEQGNYTVESVGEPGVYGTDGRQFSQCAQIHCQPGTIITLPGKNESYQFLLK